MQNLRSILIRLFGGSSNWQPVIRSGMSVPIQMRKRGADGKWLYREPTEREIQEFIEAEAW